MDSAVQSLLASSLGEVLTPAEAQELVAAGASRSVARGSLLSRVGDSDKALYVILDGSLQVVIGPNPQTGSRVAVLGAGQLAGELEVMTHSLRVASLVAMEDTTVLELPAAELERLLADNRAAANKVVHVIARTLARRLAAVNQRITAAAPPEPEVPKEVLKKEEPVEVAEAKVVEVDDDDLAVLDKLWG